jgi:predicted DNA-binding transcriptional regulator AlpA
MKASCKKQEEQPVRGKLLNVKQAVEKAGMGKSWFYERMRNGTLPFPWFFPTPGKRLFDSADIEDWHRKIKVPAGTSPQGI